MRNLPTSFRFTPLVIAMTGLLVSATPSAAQSGGKEGDGVVINSEAKQLAEQQPDWMRPFVAALYRDGEWGAVLNLNRMGLAAMEKRNFPLARKSFDEAIVRVEAIYADDPNAAKARSVFNAEKVKDFKGEPYERSMLYYYRGLLYAQDGDYQNARASFLAADRHDALSSAEPGAYVGNFGLMKYLAGWASKCDGDGVRAGQLIGEARAIDSKIQALSETPDNALVLIDVGVGPVKWGDGQYKELLKFRPATQVEPAFSVRAAGKEYTNALTAGDVNFQATTRGGREIDAVMNGKARFKGGADVVGEVAMTAGIQTALSGISSGNNNIANAGMFGMLVGFAAKAVAAATTPAADIRQWDSLPAKIALLQAPGMERQSLTLVVDGQAREWPIEAKNGNCSVAWARTASALGVERGGTTQFSDDKPVESNRGDRNRVFRSMLSTELVASK